MTRVALLGASTLLALLATWARKAAQSEPPAQTVLEQPALIHHPVGATTALVLAELATQRVTLVACPLTTTRKLRRLQSEMPGWKRLQNRHVRSAGRLPESIHQNGLPPSFGSIGSEAFAGNLMNVYLVVRQPGT